MAYPRFRLTIAALMFLPAISVAEQSKLAGTWTLVEGVKVLAGNQEPIPDAEHGQVYLIVRPDGGFFKTATMRHSFLDDVRNKGDKYVTPNSSLEVVKSVYEPDKSVLVLNHNSGYQLSVEATLLDNGMVAYRSTVPSYGGADLIVQATLQRVDSDRPWEDHEHLIATWKVAGGTPFAVDVSADGRFIVAADLAGRVAYLWDAQQDKQLRVFEGHTNDVSAVAISPDGKYVATGSRITGGRKTDDQSLRIWNATSGEQLQHVEAFSTVNSLAFPQDGTVLAAGVPSSKIGKATAGIWNVETGEQLRNFLSLYDVRDAVAFPNGQSVLCVWSAVGKDGPVGLYDVASGKEVRRIGKQIPSVDIVTVSPDGTRMLTSSQEPFLREWEIDTGKEVRQIQVDQTWASQVAYMPDGRRIVTANESDNALHIWSLSSGEQLATLTGHRDHIHDMKVSTDGLTIVTCSDDGTVKVWRVPN